MGFAANDVINCSGSVREALVFQRCQECTRAVKTFGCAYRPERARNRATKIIIHLFEPIRVVVTRLFEADISS